MKVKWYLAQMLAENQLDIISFTSPSTVDHFMEVVKNVIFSDKHPYPVCLPVLDP